MYDMRGRIIIRQEITENVTAIDTTNWTNGTYVWKVFVGTSTGSVTEAERGKWIKE